MKRILVTGNTGSGKSTISQELSELLNIYVYNLDNIVPRSRWQQAPLSQCRSKLKRIIEREQWIIDGVCLQAIKSADVIIFLDLPRLICYWQIFKRSLRYLFKSRPELSSRCPEILILGYLIRLTWNFPKLVRPALLRSLKQISTEKTIIYIHSYEQLRRLLQTLTQQHQLETSCRYKFI